jgi:hypothetical protein
MRFERLFLALALLGCSPDHGQHYEGSIRQAAVRTPGAVVPLHPLPPGEVVTMSHFTEWGVPATPTTRYAWVSVPAQLQALCRGKPDAVLAIQQVLGLPPQPTPSRPDHRWQVVTFQVPRSALFRPCPGGTDPDATQCHPSQVPTELDPEATRFLLEQMWSSWRSGFHGQPGYPFTGMGWSYNWDPTAPHPVGISEYVLKRGTPLAQMQVATPEAFCNAP